MSDSFDCILDRMCKVIHRVDAPLITGIMMCHTGYTVEDRISHIDIRWCHIYLRTENLLSVCILACTHIFKKLQVLFHTSVTVRAVFSRLCQSSSVLTDLIRCQVTDISFSFLDQFDCILIHLIKIIRCKVKVISPVSTQPFDVGFDGFYELCLFLCRVGIVKTHMECSVIFLCKSVV